MSDRLSERIADAINHLAVLADSVPLSDVALHLDNADRGFVAELTDWTEPKRKESA